VSAAPPPRDRSHPTAVAIRRAAAELFSERSPSSVSLRQIAERAGVNYGLIHHWFGTKEALLRAVFADASAHGAELIADAPDVRSAMATLLPTSVPTAYGHMLAWALVDGATAEQFDRSAAMARLRALIEEDWLGTGVPSSFDPRLVAAVAVATLLGWQFFQPFLRSAGDLDDLDDLDDPDDPDGADSAARVVDLLELMIRAAATPRVDARRPPGPELAIGQSRAGARRR
jgi:AcrR family transcriptional regulator